MDTTVVSACLDTTTSHLFLAITSIIFSWFILFISNFQSIIINIDIPMIFNKIHVSDKKGPFKGLRLVRDIKELTHCLGYYSL